MNPRRRFLCSCVGAFSGLLAAEAQAVPWASRCDAELPAPARELVARCFVGIDPTALWDTHCHLLGNGDSGSGCRLHPSLTSGINLVERARHRVILDAACVRADAPSVDRAYVDSLLNQAAGFPIGARWLLLAFDQAHDEHGEPDAERTTMFVPDSYAQAVVARHPERLGWVASIHPYRTDALQALQRAHAGGALALKWLPSSMAIDLRDARSVRLGEAAAALGMPVIVHCGEERAVPGAEREEWVNPLHVRPLLERGARVIVAHCATLGMAEDSDKPSRPQVPAFELFARLMDEPAFDGRLLGDISAVFLANRRPEVWRRLLQSAHWHGRLLQGSDHPLPGLKPLTRLGKLQSAGLLAEQDVPALDALREHNPLLFDFALKRSVRLGSARLADGIFATRRHFGRA